MSVEMKLEVIVIPVSNVDRAKRFYEKLGWRLDADFKTGEDFRVLQLTPPGSECSIIFGKGVSSAAPGSGSGSAPRRLRHREGSRRARRPRRRRQRGVPRRWQRVPPRRSRGTCAWPGSESARLLLVLLVQRSGRQRLGAPGGEDARAWPLTGRERPTRGADPWTLRL